MTIAAIKLTESDNPARLFYHPRSWIIMKPTPEVCTIQVRSARKIIDAAAEAGVKPEELYRAVQLDPVLLKNPDNRIPFAQIAALYEHAAALTGDDAFGLHLAERSDLKAFDALGYAIMHSPTLGDALERCVRYFRIWTDGEAYSLEQTGPQTRFVHIITDSRVDECRHNSEFTFAFVLSFSRGLMGAHWMPRSVGFQHRQPKDVSEHNRIFGPRVRFDRPANDLVFDTSLLSLPLKKADPNLCAVLDRHAEDLLAKLPERSGMADLVRHLLGQALRGGDPGIESISKQIGMSSRSLQRKLKQEGTSHQTLLDKIRSELSGRYLLEPDMTICEVAYLLGFSEPSAFNRAFKRWTGTTPKEYRKARKLA